MFTGKVKFNDTDYTAVVYPFDFSNEGEELGAGTISRLEALIALQKKQQYQIKCVVLTAGIAPNKKIAPKQTETFARMMKKYLVENREMEGVNILISSDNNVWKSWGETFEMMWIIEEEDLPKNIIIISDRFHLYPRLWLMWRIIKPRDWSLTFVGANAGYSFFKLLSYEIPGTVLYLYKSFRYKIMGIKCVRV